MKCRYLKSGKIEDLPAAYAVRLMEQGKVVKATEEEAAAYEAKAAAEAETGKKKSGKVR